MQGRGLRPDQTRAPNGGTALHVMRRQGGYRVNLDGSVSTAAEVFAEREAQEETHPTHEGETE